MAEVTLWHNPRCTKSRSALTLLEEKGIHPTIRLYLVDPPDARTLQRILRLLKIRAEDLVRKNEPIYKEHFKGKILTDEAWIQVLLKYPRLIQRPIVIYGRKAKIGRPPEKLLDLF